MLKKIFAGLLGVMVLFCTVAAQAEPIRFGVLPVLDTLPLQVAVHEGLFKKQGLEVELIPFNSALERDVAMQAGQLDGCFGDMVSCHMLSQSGTDIRIGLVSYHTDLQRRMFGIVTSPMSSAGNIASLKGHTIGISRSTIIEYLLDTMIARKMVSPDTFHVVEIKKFPVRLQMLGAGKIDSALLPEPLLSLMEEKGGSVVLTDAELDIPLTVLCLKAQYFAGDAATYKAFVRAYKQAVLELNTHPAKWQALMTKTCRVPAPLADSFPVYTYPVPVLPSASAVRDVQQWMLKKGTLRKAIPYEKIVSPVDPVSIS